MRKRVILDIGTHKTGSSSRQQFCGKNRDGLRSVGVDFYSGRFFDTNHVELHMACMESERLSPARLRLSGRYSPDDLFEETRSRIHDFVSDSQCDTLFFSAEGISYLRTEDEVSRLLGLFDGCRVKVVVYLRDKTEFLRSYSGQLLRSGITLSDDPSCFSCVIPDSWLVDYERFARLYEPGRNCDALSVYGYEQVMTEHSSVVPHLVREILCLSVDFGDAVDVWANKSPGG